MGPRDGTETFNLGDAEPTPLEKPGAPAEAPETYELPARLEIKRVLARGGMGVVLEVHDTVLDRDVAVKILPRGRRGDRDVQARFLREARAVATLHHPGIVTVHDIDPDGGFIVMELIRGESLQERLRRDGRLPAAEVRRLGLALLAALSEAHAAGIVHRDVKPGNILLTDAGVVKLADFGIAAFDDSDLTTTGTLIGTPAYMAPEQLRGLVATPRSDVYATGATLFEAATATRIHQADGPITDPGPRVREITGDSALAAAIAGAVHERPADRWASAEDFAAALRVDAASPGATHAGGAVAPRSRRRIATAIAASVAIAAAVGTAAFVSRSRAMRPPIAAAVNAPATVRVALLPFTDHVGDPRLDFAVSGLPHLLAGELRRAPGLTVIGYYDLQDRVAAPGDAAAWRGAAASLGARTTVEGSVERAADGLRVTIIVTGPDDATRTVVRDVADVNAVPDAVRLAAGEVASAILGRKVAIVAVARPSFESDRALQLGVAALERHDFPAAEELLVQASALTPTSAEPHYYLAILQWWMSRPADGTRREIDLALHLPLDESRRGFLEGLRLLVSQDYVGATAYFRRLTDRFPKDRDILYGLMEALFHGGHPADAMVVYRAVCELAPHFSLGYIHPLGYYIAHADASGIEWALTRVTGPEEGHVLWTARAEISRRDYAAAIDQLQRLDDKASTGNTDSELATLYLLSGQIGLAEALLRRLDDASGGMNPAPLLAIAVLTADATAERTRWVAAIARAEQDVSGAPRIQSLIDLALLAVPGDSRERLATIADQLATTVPHPGASLPVDVALALIAGVREDSPGIAAARASVFPEAAAVGDAFTADLAGSHAQAATAMLRAIEASTDGKLLIVEQWVRAGMLVRAGDPAVADACDEVTRPRTFTWAWASATGSCERWAAEAELARGHVAAARAHWEQIVAQRTRASSDDPLLAAARTGLASLDGR